MWICTVSSCTPKSNHHLEPKQPIKEPLLAKPKICVQVFEQPVGAASHTILPLSWQLVSAALKTAICAPLPDLIRAFTQTLTPLINITTEVGFS
jgi:hypothetical protein